MRTYKQQQTITVDGNIEAMSRNLNVYFMAIWNAK